ncbi:MAG: DUF1735 domain-containing protein [Prevotellaceae bacterium]|jgi:hypothetical protein|nr:DUF1735 domain-containing protein [Prevotellaceae bacterium]
MKKTIFYIAALALVAQAFSACELVDPLASEQYQKNIYIIGAHERVSAFNLPYGDGQEAFVSISASGTKRVDKDVEITLRQNNDILDWYNGKYMLDAPVKYRQLNAALVNIPSWKTTLRAGELYTHLPFKVTTTGLHCDSLYAIGIAIESVSSYQQAESGTELIFTLKLSNDYSGTYQLDASKVTLRAEVADEDTTWVEQGLAIPVSIQRTLTATSHDAVRFFHEKQKETLAEYSNSYNPGKDYFDAIEKYCIRFVKAEGNKFTVEPWGSMSIVDGEAEYNAPVFTFRYDYMEGTSRYRMSGSFRGSSF